MINYSYETFLEDVRVLSKQIQAEFEPDVVLGIARGGATLAHFLAESFKIRDLFALNSIHYGDDNNKLDTIKVYNIPDLSEHTNILLADDIIDSGETLIEIKRVLLEKYPHINIKTVTLFYKEKALMKPDFTAKHADDWINFFWQI